MTVCLVALGSNVGNRQQHLQTALARLAAHRNVRIVAASKFRETSAAGGTGAPPPFLNAAVLLETALDPASLHRLLIAIEDEAQRQRVERWGPRSLDLDLLLYGEQTIDTVELVVPHPRMAVRRFVLEPAAEIAGHLVHPATGWTIDELNRHLNAAPNYVALAGSPGSGKTALAKLVAARSGAEFVADVAPTGMPRARLGSSGPVECLKLELAEELRLSAGRTEHVASRTRSADTEHWLISDFWMPQALVYAKLQLADAEYGALLKEWAVFERDMTAAKFTVWLDFESHAVGEPHTLRDRLNRELAELLGPPARGPVLRLRVGDTPEPVEQVLAAMASAQ